MYIWAKYIMYCVFTNVEKSGTKRKFIFSLYFFFFFFFLIVYVFSMVI